MIDLLESGSDSGLKARLEGHYVTRSGKEIGKRYIISSKRIVEYCGEHKHIQFMKRMKTYLEKIGAVKDHGKNGNVWAFPPKADCVGKWNNIAGNFGRVDEGVTEWEVGGDV